jgi:hypothetical protein
MQPLFLPPGGFSNLAGRPVHRYEYGDASLMSWVSNFTHSVGRVGGQKHVSTVASQRDEPGITRAAVPLLVDAGVTGCALSL